MGDSMQEPPIAQETHDPAPDTLLINRAPGDERATRATRATRVTQLPSCDPLRDMLCDLLEWLVMTGFLLVPFT